MMAVRVRCAAVLALATLVLGGITRLGLTATLGPSADPADGVVRICAVALVAALGWGYLTVVAGVVDAWRRAARPVGVVPTAPAAGIRRLVLVACGVAVAGALTAPLAQAAAPRTEHPSAVAARAHLDRAGPARTRPDQVHSDRARLHPQAVPAVPVVVRRGDCLWSIAAAQVQPGAGPMTVTARWHALYAANRGVIGPDPDLIRPGQRLRWPG